MPEEPVPAIDPLEARKLEIDSWKTMLDFLKHITTLSAGSIVLLAGLVDKASLRAASSLTLGVCILVTSIVVLCMSMFGCSTVIRRPALEKKYEPKLQRWLIVGLGSFLLGTTCLGVYILASVVEHVTKASKG